MAEGFEASGFAPEDQKTGDHVGFRLTALACAIVAAILHQPNTCWILNP